MVHPFTRISVGAMALALGLAAGITAPAPALAARPDCSSNASLGRVHRRLDGAMDALQRDRHDYGGHRVAAIGDLQNARNELAAAQGYAVTVDRENARCFGPGGADAGDTRRGMRNQRNSNGNVAYVARRLGALIAQLDRDQRDYAGHRVAAIRDMQAARTELAAADAYARAHGR